MALRAYRGKGSPQDIFEEVQSILIKERTPLNSLTDQSLKKILTDADLGVDCSAFTYYVLNAQSEYLKKGPLDKHISFVNCHGLLGKIRCSLKPVENCDVATFSADANSRVIPLSEIEPGDIITMVQQTTENPELATTSRPDPAERNHVLVIHQVDYQNYAPTIIHYSHAVAYPEDGEYGTGVKQGTITISAMDKPISEQIWKENGLEGMGNRIYNRANKSRTEVRRMRL